MDIETLLRKAEQDGCMVVLNDIAPDLRTQRVGISCAGKCIRYPCFCARHRRRHKKALQNKNHGLRESTASPLRWEKSAAKQLHIAQDACRTGRECGD